MNPDDENLMNPDDVPLVAKLSDGNLCLSGGAKGADATWGEEASKIGHQVIHWSFEGHKSHGNPDHTIKLDDETLKEADIRLDEANLSLKRRVPYGKPWIANLLRRNWFQIKYATTVYAVGTLNENATMYDYLHIQSKHDPLSKSDHLGIDGGTAWACQMYLDYYLERKKQGIYHFGLENQDNDDLEDPDLIDFDFNLIFYDQEKRDIWSYDPFLNCWKNPVLASWNSSLQHLKPEGIYAAIGSRDLTLHGKEFIKSVMAL